MVYKARDLADGKSGGHKDFASAIHYRRTPAGTIHSCDAGHDAGSSSAYREVAASWASPTTLLGRDGMDQRFKPERDYRTDGIRGTLEWKDIWRVAVHVGRALAEAEKRKLVHRNVTPTNILRRDKDKAYLLTDLVFAKALEETAAAN